MTSSSSVGSRRNGLGAALVPVALLAIVPLATANPYLLSVWTFIGINLIVVVGLDLLLGYCGQLSLGHGVFVSLGAYSSALLTTRAGWSGWVAIPVGMAAAGVAAFLVAVPTLRLRGYYLAMATLGFPVVFDAFIRFTSDVSGGSSGVVGVPRLRIAGFVLKGQVPNYLFVLGVFTVVILAASWFSRSRWSLSLRAIHGDEPAAAARGIDVYRTKIAVFVASAVLAGLSGSLYVHYVQFVAPDTFGIFFSIMLVVFVIVGGAGRIWGAVLGTVLLMWLPELLRSTATWEPIVFGTVLATVMLCAPAGIAGLWRRRPSITGGPALREWASELRPSRDPVGLLPRASASVPLLSARSLTKRYDGILAVDGVSLELGRGQVKAIIGPNGAGKSTALALIAGAILPDRGAIEFDGVRVERMAAHRRARLGIGRTFQHTRLIQDLTVLENVMLGLHARRGDTSGDRGPAAAWAIAENLGLAEVAHRRPGEINYYHSRLTELATALAGDPRVLLLDEPAAGLSRAEVDQLTVLLRAEREKGRSIMLVDHVMQLVLGLADEILVLEQGAPIAEGAPDAVLKDRRVRSAYLGTRQGADA